MSDEADRVARVSDLAALETRLLGELERRTSEEGAAIRHHIEHRFGEFQQHVDERVNEEGTAVRQHIETRFSDVQQNAEKRFRDFEQNAEKRSAEDAVTTRRYFDIMVEKVEESVKLVAEVTAHHSTRLDDHERRLKKIEKRRA
jgi:hypothetical protein